MLRRLSAIQAHSGYWRRNRSSREAHELARWLEQKNSERQRLTEKAQARAREQVLAQGISPMLIAGDREIPAGRLKVLADGGDVHPGRENVRVPGQPLGREYPPVREAPEPDPFRIHILPTLEVEPGGQDVQVGLSDGQDHLVTDDLGGHLGQVGVVAEGRDEVARAVGAALLRSLPCRRVEMLEPTAGGAGAPPQRS